MAYDKEQPLVAGGTLADLAAGLKDGFDPDDAALGLAFLQAMGVCIDEIKEDTPSTLMYIGSAFMEKAADLRRAEAAV